MSSGTWKKSELSHLQTWNMFLLTGFLHLCLPNNVSYLFACFAVKENALAGTVVIKLTLTDLDSEIPASIAFYITSGNPLGQFAVRNTGEVYVTKPVDRELTDIYHLNVTATDGKYVTSTTLTINILDVNGKHRSEALIELLEAEIV